MRAAVLALQGAFAEHERILEDMGVECMEIRQEKDAYQDFDALILPGGESTAMGKLLRDYHLLGILKEKIEKGLPVLGTCAGLILLAKQLTDGTPHLATMPVTVKRNAYGRQLGSFVTEADMKGIGRTKMVFIRAPYIVEAGEETEILAQVDGRIVAVRYKKQIGLSFHPELTDCRHIYEMLFHI